MPLTKPKPRKSKPPNLVAGHFAERISDGKPMFCFIDNKNTLWCRGYEPNDLWEAYAWGKDEPEQQTLF